MKIGIVEPPKNKYFKWETSSSIYIPYKCFWNSNTVLLKNNAFLRIIKIKGFSFETADDEDIDIKKEARNNLLKGMVSGNIGLYFHTIRKKKETIPEGEMTNVYAKRIND